MHALRLYTAVAGAVALLTGCSDPTFGTGDATDQMLAMEVLYCSGDIATAERALHDFLRLRHSQEAHGVRGIDYLYGRAMTHARLFALYRQQGEEPKAKEHWALCAGHLVRWDIMNDRPLHQYDQEAILAYVARLDRGLDVKWRRSNPIPVPDTDSQEEWRGTDQDDLPGKDVPGHPAGG